MLSFGIPTSKIILTTSLVLLMGAVLPCCAYSLTLNLVTDDTETFPYYMGNRVIREHDPGISVEIIQQAAKRHGLEVKIIRMPWKRALDSMGRNIVDGAFNASFKPKRMELGRYPEVDGKVDSSKRLATIRHVVYKLKPNQAAWDGEKFIGLNLPVGVVHSYSIADDLRKMGASLDTAPDPLANLNKLVLGRLGMIVESEVKLDRMLAKFPERYDDVVKLDQPFKIKPTYLMLSHQFVERHPELAEKLWASIGEIGRSEEIQKRYRHYFTNY